MDPNITINGLKYCCVRCLDPNSQQLYKVSLNLYWLSKGGGLADFSENLRDSLFNDDLSNKSNFSLNHLARQYL